MRTNQFQTDLELFSSQPVPVIEAAPPCAELSQYFTPAWFAELLYDAHFSHLGAKDLLWEPTAGTGACLAAVPDHVPAFGSEIDPRLARIAAKRTGRRVVVGDFRDVELPEGVTAIFGNPPFELSLLESLLEIGAEKMVEGSKCGLLLPAYFFQTSSTVVRLNSRWTIAQEMIPRDLFFRPAQMKRPLMFALFTRDNAPRLIGLRGYRETSEVRALNEKSQVALDESFQGPRSVWKEVFRWALEQLGGEAPLSSIYSLVEGRRPTGNAHWKEQLRKVAREHFSRVAEGVYSLPRPVGAVA